MTEFDHEIDGTPLLRIGELSRRVGVKADRLRAWEHRYGLLEPTRTAGGFRLYSLEDEGRVLRMLDLLAEGLAAAEAAHAIIGRASSEPMTPETVRAQLAAAFARFDEAEADRVFSRALGGLGEDATVQQVIYPLLREIGDAWECGDVDVAQEHFASGVIQRRLMALLPADGRTAGAAHAVLACAPGEHHVLGLIGLGVGLRRRGWRVTYLGADTPILEIVRTARLVQPSAVVLGATLPHRIAPHTDDLRRLADENPLLLGGAGADAEVADRVGARYLDADPVEAAALIAGGSVPGGIGPRWTAG